jgi:hypothetical protein
MTSGRPPTDPDPDVAEEDPDSLQLDPDVLADGDATCEVLRSWVRADRDAAERQDEIDGYIRHVESFADETVWDLVQQALACIQRRDEDLALLIARRSFQDGLRCRPGDVEEAPGLPALTRDVLADHGLLGTLRRAWSRVRDRVDDRTWRRVLAAEELLNHRAATAQEILMAFAYRAGSRRSPGGSR